MKTINTYINEKLRLTTTQKYTCHPKDKDELRKIIIRRLKKEGTNCDLNDIDVSKITDMSRLFASYTHGLFEKFNWDISMWDVSNVENMYGMFNGCYEFDCDISKWNVSNVKNMRFMFYYCEKFNQNLDSWDVPNVKEMNYAFYKCPTQPKWYDKDKWEDVMVR